MFTRWNLVRNPFDTNPISLGTLDWFVGRQRELQLCRRLVTEQSVVLVEGALGVGTTSFGNVVRFGAQREQLTPRMELAVYRNWNAQTLLENVLVAVLHDIIDEPNSKQSAVVRQARALVQRVEHAVHGAGMSLMGFGGQVNRSVAVTQPGIVPMETLRQTLIALASEFRSENRSVTFTVQLNNLDPNLTFTEEELTIFLNDIRDSLQLSGFSWILVGKKGLAQFITRRVPRLRSIISHDVSLAPLSLKQVEEVVKKRIAACALPEKKGKNPIATKLLGHIYEASGGSLRETFLVCSKLCLALAGTPMYDTITKEDAGELLAELLAVRLADIKNSPLKCAILKELSGVKMLTQKDLAERLGKSQTAVSRAIKALIESDLVRHRKEGREVRYWSAAEVKLATDQL